MPSCFPSSTSATLYRQPVASDPVDLEELLGGVVLWVRQKVDGKAPPEVCQFLLRVVSMHAVPSVVLAAKEALLELLAESSKVVSSQRGCLCEPHFFHVVFSCFLYQVFFLGWYSAGLSLPFRLLFV